VALIELHGLIKRFGATLAVDHLSFEVAAGTIVGFLGPNGAGKTTTLRMLLGLVEPSAGRATICGQPYRMLEHPLRQVGAVLDGCYGHPGRSARAHLRIQAMAAGVGRVRIEEALALVGLTQAADRRIGEFSLGMRQRLALATALLPNPEVLILDEPANGLDPEGMRWLRNLLRTHADQGGTVLLSSHILAEVSQNVDVVAIINQGRLIACSPLEELLVKAEPVIRVRTPQAAELADLLLATGAHAHLVAADRLEVTATSPERVAQLAAEHAVPIVESATDAPDLEEVFLALTGDNEGQKGPS
jgi:ABC-2 type transport system ATP-binding protein